MGEAAHLPTTLASHLMQIQSTILRYESLFAVFLYLVLVLKSCVLNIYVVQIFVFGSRCLLPTTKYFSFVFNHNCTELDSSELEFKLLQKMVLQRSESINNICTEIICDSKSLKLNYINKGFFYIILFFVNKIE